MTQQEQRPTREDIIRAVAQSPEKLDEGLDGFLGGDASAPHDLAEDEEVLETVRGRASAHSATRETEQREPATWLPRAQLPDPNPEPGYVFRYVRIGLGGKADDVQNVAGRMREGWVPVRPEEQPEIARTLPDGGKGQDRIVIGDVMLVKASAEMKRQRSDYYGRQSQQQIRGVQQQLLKIQDARMPMLKPSTVTTTSKKLV